MQKEVFSGLKLDNEEPIYTQEYIQSLRDTDKKHPDKLKIIAQRGGQERMLSIDADIKIVGGSRGGPLEEDTLVLTERGEIKIKDVKENDIVYDFGHEKSFVMKNVFFGELPCYRITLDNGLVYESSFDHIWPVFIDDADHYLHFLTTIDLFVSKSSFHFIDINLKEIHVKSIEFIGKRKCYCLAVSSTRAVFALHGGIMTHNSKSFSSLMEVLKDIKNPDFHATILRNEKDDLQSLVTDSYKLFSQFGTYNKSQNDMTWNFDNGGWLKFSYYAGAYQDFKTRFQGRQYAYVCIDEGTQCPYKKFKYLLTNNRNAAHIRNRFWITCNPDPESWVRKFIDWWVDENGYIIPERDGVIRYCFMDGDTPDSIYWGNTREEVYEQCKGIIDSLWKDSYEELGYTKLEMFIKSATFIRADVSENIKLISTDASYIANLAQQDEEQRMRDLEANWNWKAAGDDMIKMEDLDEIYDNAEQIGDGKRRASADIAFTGGDNFVMWLWEGWHCKDLVVLRLDPKTLVSVVEARLREWGVEECNFTYDLQGIGQYFKGFFKDAVPFNNQAAPIAKNHQEEEGIKYLYKDLKSQCAWLFYKMIKDKQISIDSSLLERKYSGNGFDKVPLRQILQKERKMLRRDENSDDKGFKLLPKKTAKKYVGHSPDFFESWLYIMIFSLTKKKNKKVKGLWMLSR